MALNRKIAIIDLDRNIIDVFPVSVDCRTKFLGGRGLGAYLLCRHSSKACKPPGAENVCVISAGLLGGTLSAPFGYAVVTAGSPLTGLMTWECLEGPFSSEMRQAGFDHLIFKGRAKGPVYFFIHDGEIEIRDAHNVSRKSPIESRNMFRDATAGKETRLLCVHKAGDEQSRIADGSSTLDFEVDRSGIGTVLAAKNIKAIACHGTLNIEVKDPEGIIDYERNIRTHAVSGEPPSSGSDGGIVGGDAGKVTLQEIKETIAQCLGIPYGNGTEGNKPVFSTVPAQVRYNTGLDLNKGDLRDIAYRCITLERLYNLREGIAGKGGPMAANYRKNGWTRTAVVRKGKVFDRLGIGDLWSRLK